MEQTLRQFICGSLYDASNLLLDKLHIQHTQEEPTPMRYSNYFDGEIPQYIQKQGRRSIILTRHLLS